MSPSCTSSTTTWLDLAMLLWFTAMATAARQEGVPSVNATMEATRYYKKAAEGHHYREHSKPDYYPRDTLEDNRLPGTQEWIIFKDLNSKDGQDYSGERVMDDYPSGPAPHYGTYDAPHSRYGGYHEEHRYPPHGYDHKPRSRHCKPNRCQPRRCTCECDLPKVPLSDSNGCNATRPCTTGELGALCVDTVPGAPNTCSASIQPASWAYCTAPNPGIVVDGVVSGSEWSAVPVSGRDVTLGFPRVVTNGDNFALRVTSDNNGIYLLAQTFNASSLTYTAINWGLLGNNAAWRYRIVDSNQCGALSPVPTNPPVCFQKGNDSSVGSPSGLTTLRLSDASIQLAATFDSATNTSTQEAFVPWSSVLDGQNGWNPTASALSLVFAGSWYRNCPAFPILQNSCVGRWGKPGIGDVGDFFTNQSNWALTRLSVNTPIDFPALCYRVECPREGRISIQGSSVPVGVAQIPGGCDITDGLYLYSGAFNTTALVSNTTSVNYEGPCTANQAFNLCEINGIILTSSLRFKFTGQYTDTCPAQCTTLGCAGGPL